ncbi:MAG: glycerophosphodiester phosphodiesterase family protein, partial [Pseudomonadota bacterium]
MVRANEIEVGPRPAALIDAMAPGALKDRLADCAGRTVERTDFSIAHRGAPLQFPEHTAEGYRAAARMGAGVIECDVTFTADLELVCRHAQNDLHATTDILATPLAAKCAEPFALAANGAPASAECRAVDLTLEEFRELSAKMDGIDPTAETVEAFMAGAPDWRTTLYAPAGGALLTHAESIALIGGLGAKFAPELKAPVVEMPFKGFTREAYAQKLIDEYKAAGVPPSDVWAQSFRLEDVLYWIENEPAFGAQAVYLDGRFATGLDPARPSTFSPTMEELKAMGVNFLAPPIWMLLTLDGERMAPSPYAKAATAAGLELIAWTLERSGPLSDGGGWYYQTVAPAMTGEGAVYEALDVLAQDVGVVGV